MPWQPNSAWQRGSPQCMAAVTMIHLKGAELHYKGKGWGDATCTASLGLYQANLQEGAKA